jgi:hypothetical protein
MVEVAARPLDDCWLAVFRGDLIAVLVDLQHDVDQAAGPARAAGCSWPALGQFGVGRSQDCNKPSLL